MQAAKENEHVYYQRPPQEVPALLEPRRLVAATALPLPQAAASVKELTALDAFAAVPQAEEQTAPGETARAPLATAGPSSSAPAAPAGDDGPAFGFLIVKRDARGRGSVRPALWGQKRLSHWRAGEAGKVEAPAGKQESASCWRWLLVILAMPVLVLLSAVGAIIWLVLLPLKIICCPIGEPPGFATRAARLIARKSSADRATKVYHSCSAPCRLPHPNHGGSGGVLSESAFQSLAVGVGKTLEGAESG